MLGCGAAATTDQIEPTLVCKLLNDGHHFLSGLIVLTELIGQSCIRMHADRKFAALMQFIQPRAQFLGAQCAIQADANRIGMTDRIDEGLDGLARQRPATAVGDGA